jgi:hypothetical protein
MSAVTQDRIRQAAVENGWAIKARKGEVYTSAHGVTRWDRDIFQIGRVDRYLQNGTPVTECEHDISVWYRHDGAVWFATAHTYTVPRVIYREGVARGEKNKAARIIAALRARTSDIPEEVRS